MFDSYYLILFLLFLVLVKILVLIRDLPITLQVLDVVRMDDQVVATGRKVVVVVVEGEEPQEVEGK